MNLHLYNALSIYSDIVLYFDTNKFINNFTLYNGKMFLPKTFKRRLATLVAYNIQHFKTNVSSSTNKLINFLE